MTKKKKSKLAQCSSKVETDSSVIAGSIYEQKCKHIQILHYIHFINISDKHDIHFTGNFCYQFTNDSLHMNNATSTSLIMLFCLIKGEKPDKAFKVIINKDKDVSDLKKVIKDEIPNDFAGIDAKNLTLWKVNVSANDKSKFERLETFIPYNSAVEEVLLGEKIENATEEVGKIFNYSLEKECIHIIIEPPATTEGTKVEEDVNFIDNEDVSKGIANDRPTQNCEKQENLSDSTLIKLRFNKDTPLLFITNFKNLQELEFSVNNFYDLKDYEKLENFNFPQLQILKIPYPYKFLIKFLEYNGKHLKEIYISDSKGYNDNSINLSIANFCTKIRKLSTGFKYNELDTLKLVFYNCQCLESIKLWCGSRHLSEKEALEMVMKFSHDNLCEIILSYESDVRSSLLPEEFESFLIYWKNCVSRKSLSLIIVNLDYKSLDKNVENTKLIDKYIKLGVIKKFKVTNFEDAEFSHNYYNKVQQILCR
ncbi:hypothetical protein RhiirA5_381184 [Rhizophagus irregularis]|uniref:Crinkler effector protein N-terminal domain-containing protein n=1 Tax=Rhizophagus irregularis TaxID=588596 RepID=A0A2N0P5Q9_9GLOM|nr:hypothetical protein RhiirA5_381184 [Rhizophagus irregularis]